MGTLYDYLKWRGDLSFSEVPMNDVDSLIFSLISYMDLAGIVPEDPRETSIPLKTAANSFFARHPDPKKISMGVIVPKEIITLFREAKDTRRFRSVELCAHTNLIDPVQEMQFSATTFLLEDGSTVVAYRGTDDTLIGWKENFNMSFLTTVPAQQHATEYLEHISLHFAGNLYVTGHSKGGNLAVYAAVHAASDVRNRIRQVWSNDGPGFSGGMLTDPAYLEMRARIKTLVPQSSVVGMLLEHDENYIVVKSRQAGPFQHDGMSWNVMGGSFVILDRISEGSRKLDRTLNDWVRSMTPEQREEFVDAMYRVLSVNNATTLTELVSNGKQLIFKGKKQQQHLDPQVYQTIQKTLALLFDNKKNSLTVKK